MPTITIIDRKRTFEANAGMSLMMAIEVAGGTITHACGGNCICGTCNVEILESQVPLPEPAPAEAYILSRIKRKGPNVRLSCQAIIKGDMLVRISPERPPEQGQGNGDQKSGSGAK